MATFTLYNLEGKEVGSVEQPALFSTEVDQKLIHRYFIWVRTMLRATIAHTKTRGDVSGGGRKPWKQKGTGRARVGSSRSPIWRGGGTVFGPLKEQNWATRMPRSERRKALFSALSSKAKEGNVFILDKWEMEAPKTKEVQVTLAGLPIKAEHKVLHIHPDSNNAVFLSTRNLKMINSKTIQKTNIIDILSHDVLLMTQEGLLKLDEHFSASL